MSAELGFTAFAKPGSCGLSPVTDAFKSVAKLGGAAESIAVSFDKIAVSFDKIASAATKAAKTRDHGEKMKEGITSAGMYVGLGIGAGIAFAGYIVANAIKAAQGNKVRAPKCKESTP